MSLRGLISLFLMGLVTIAKAELPPGASLLDTDIVWDPTLTESVAVSPDEKKIAYVSRGALWVCDIFSGTPIKLTDLPNTVTAILALPEYESERQQFASDVPDFNLHPLHHLRFDLVGLFNLRWTPSQDGVTYTLWHRLKKNSMLSSYRVMHVTTRGVVTQLADIVREMVALPESKMSFHVTPDRQHVIMSHYGIPLIWDCKTNRPRVTPFDFLLPSKMGDRFLAVEIDTRQFVLVDKDFQIIKRFEVVLEQDRRCDLFWSPDERTAICRSFRSSMEPISDHCTFFRVDLATDRRTEPRHGRESDKFCFTKNTNEFLRIGRDKTPRGGYADGSNGTFIELIPDIGPSKELYHFVRLPKRTDDYREHRTYPPVIVNSDGTLLAMALPRADSKPRGYHFHLLDRKGHTWPFQLVKDSPYYSPYLPLEFVDEGRTLIARNATQLFSVPVESIKAKGRENND